MHYLKTWQVFFNLWTNVYICSFLLCSRVIIRRQRRQKFPKPSGCWTKGTLKSSSFLPNIAISRKKPTFKNLIKIFRKLTEIKSKQTLPFDEKNIWFSEIESFSWKCFGYFLNCEIKTNIAIWRKKSNFPSFIFHGFFSWKKIQRWLISIFFPLQSQATNNGIQVAYGRTPKGVPKGTSRPQHQIASSHQVAWSLHWAGQFLPSRLLILSFGAATSRSNLAPGRTRLHAKFKHWE